MHPTDKNYNQEPFFAFNTIRQKKDEDLSEVSDNHQDDKKRKFAKLNDLERKGLQLEIQTLEKRFGKSKDPQDHVKLAEAKLREVESCFQAKKDLLVMEKAKVTEKDSCIAKLRKLNDEAASEMKKQVKDYKKLKEDYDTRSEELKEVGKLLDLRLDNLANLEVENHKQRSQLKQKETEQASLLKKIEEQQQQIFKLMKSVQEEQDLKAQEQKNYAAAKQELSQKEQECIQLRREKEIQEQIVGKMNTKLQTAESIFEENLNAKDREILLLKKQISNQGAVFKTIEKEIQKGLVFSIPFSNQTSSNQKPNGTLD